MSRSEAHSTVYGLLLSGLVERGMRAEEATARAQELLDEATAYVLGLYRENISGCGERTLHADFDAWEKAKSTLREWLATRA